MSNEFGRRVPDASLQGGDIPVQLSSDLAGTYDSLGPREAGRDNSSDDTPDRLDIVAPSARGSERDGPHDEGISRNVEFREPAPADDTPSAAEAPTFREPDAEQKAELWELGDQGPRVVKSEETASETKDTDSIDSSGLSDTPQETDKSELPVTERAVGELATGEVVTATDGADNDTGQQSNEQATTHPEAASTTTGIVEGANTEDIDETGEVAEASDEAWDEPASGLSSPAGKHVDPASLGVFRQALQAANTWRPMQAGETIGETPDAPTRDPQKLPPSLVDKNAKPIEPFDINAPENETVKKKLEGLEHVVSTLEEAWSSQPTVEDKVIKADTRYIQSLRQKYKWGQDSARDAEDQLTALRDAMATQISRADIQRRLRNPFTGGELVDSETNQPLSRDEIRELNTLSQADSDYRLSWDDAQGLRRPDPSLREISDSILAEEAKAVTYLAQGNYTKYKEHLNQAIQLHNRRKRMQGK